MVLKAVRSPLGALGLHQLVGPDDCAAPWKAGRGVGRPESRDFGLRMALFQVTSRHARRSAPGPRPPIQKTEKCPPLSHDPSRHFIVATLISLVFPPALFFSNRQLSKL